MTEQPLNLFIAGDALITRPWSNIAAPAFTALVDAMRRADVTFLNLETVIHTFKGYAQFDSGGTHLASPPEIAAELKWAGVDMVATANNHSFDYGSEGVLETLEHLDAAGIAAAGTGADLQTARTHGHFIFSNRSVALVAMTATLPYYASASRSRHDMPGRPGVNPLTLRSDFGITCPSEIYARLSARKGALRKRRTRSTKWRGLTFDEAANWGFALGRRPVSADFAANCSAVRDAASRSDLTIVSLHSHNERRWLKATCRAFIDVGADIVVVEGCHAIRGLEIHRGRPIFFGLGDFVFQPHLVSRYPSEAYDSVGLTDTAGPEEYVAAVRSRDSRQKAFEGAAALVTWSGGRAAAIQLLPLDLQFSAPPEERGRPQIAGRELGRQIIAEIAACSRPLGTSVRYDPEGNFGFVEL